MVKKLPVANLRVGMYVVELDRPWLGTPFDFQGFPLTGQEQIDQLKAYCKFVYIDVEREQWKPTKRSSASTPIRGTVVYTELTPVEKEVVVAREIYHSCETSLQNSLENLRADGEIDSHQLTAAVTSMPESIQRNPDAMMLLNTLRQK